jgi:hypothetical protein
MRDLGTGTDESITVYFTGGATAVLVGWRSSTIDVDIRIVPESDRLLRALPRLKDELAINVELVSPEDFIPVPAAWEDRSPFVGQEGGVSYRHFDLYAQALAKLERAHARDLEDVHAMIERGLIAPARALEYFAEIEPALYRYPAIDPRSFKARVEEALAAG